MGRHDDERYDSEDKDRQSKRKRKHHKSSRKHDDGDRKSRKRNRETTARSNVGTVHRQTNHQSLLIVAIKIENVERRIRNTRKRQSDGKRSRAKRRAERMRSDDQKTRTIAAMTLPD